MSAVEHPPFHHPSTNCYLIQHAFCNKVTIHFDLERSFVAHAYFLIVVIAPIIGLQSDLSSSGTLGLHSDKAF